MDKTYIAKATRTIHAPSSKVWEALTNPKIIKEYLFGTTVTTDWKVGSPISYKGEWEGKLYEDKGRVVEIKPENLLVSTFWSAGSGLPDAPENYKNVRYKLTKVDGGTRLTITQDKNASQEEADHSAKNWKMVLDGLKKLVES